MLKRYVFGLLAASLLIAWVVPEAGASTYSSRYRASVITTWDCSSGPCYGSTTVDEVIKGLHQVTAADSTECTSLGGLWAEGACYEVSCQMMSTVTCEGGTCGLLDETLVPVEGDSFTTTGTFIGGIAATDYANLSTTTGDAICAAAETGSTFVNCSPDQIATDSIFSPSGYELYQICPGYDFTTHKFNCYDVWDSNSSEPAPHWPCCGETNTLTTNIDPALAGAVRSSDGHIDCPAGNCSFIYDHDSSAVDQCPSVTLTAEGFEVAGAQYTLSEWEGGGCTGTGDCITSPDDPATVVTAHFVAGRYLLTAEVSGTTDRGIIYLWSSDGQNIPFTIGDINRKGECEGTCSVWLEAGQTYVAKVKWGNASWTAGSDCQGDPPDPNSIDTCPFLMDAPKNIVALFE